MKKYQDIFMKTGCLSEEMLMKYVSGKLSSAEKRDIEKHLIDCEMCSDAVEGLNMVADKKRVSEITLELNKKIRGRVEKREVKIIFFRQYRTQLAIAASVVIVFGIVWFFRKNISMNERDTTSFGKVFADKFEPYNAEKEVKGNTPVIESPVPGKLLPEISTGENANINSEEDKKNAKKNTSVSPQLLKEESKNKVKFSQPVVAQETEEVQVAASQSQGNVIGQADAMVLDKSDNLAKQPVPEKSIEAQKAQSGIKSVSFTNADVAMESNEGTVRADSVREELTPRTADADIAMQEYDQKNYSKATEDFEKTLAKDPNNYNALFYSSVSYLSIGQVDKTIANLNKVLEKKNGEFYDAAQWYLSLAYIKKRDLQNARKILMELQKNPQSKYQSRAEETLREINK